MAAGDCSRFEWSIVELTPKFKKKRFLKNVSANSKNRAHPAKRWD
jgi:hypothetical protein